MSFIGVASQHKHLVDTIAASTGLGTAVAAWLGYLQPFAAFGLAVMSGYLVYLRIRIAKNELRKQGK